MPFTGVPAAMLDLPLPVGAVWGSYAKELADRLDEAGSPEAMLELLEQALLPRLEPTSGMGLVRRTGTAIEHAAGKVWIAGLNDAAGVSSTHLAGRFKALVGITPKLLARTYRFAEVVTSLAQELAGDRVVSVAAGDVGGQVFGAGLVDEVALDVVPVVFGTGKRYLGSLSTQVMLENPDQVVVGDRVLHLRFRVRR